MVKRIYETMFVLKGNLSEEVRNENVERVKGWITNNLEGEIIEEVKWGLKKLAYVTKKGKFTEGDYTYYIYKGNADKVNELEELFKINQDIFRFQTIRREDLEKKEKKKETKITIEEPLEEEIVVENPME